MLHLNELVDRKPKRLTRIFTGASIYFAVLLLFVMALTTVGVAQTLAASSPAKEYIYFGGLLVAVEERGNGSNNAAASPLHPSQPATSAPAAATTSSGPTSSTPPSGPPTLPGPGTQTNHPSAGGPPVAQFSTSTPASTHSTGKP